MRNFLYHAFLILAIIASVYLFWTLMMTPKATPSEKADVVAEMIEADKSLEIQEKSFDNIMRAMQE